MRCVVLSFVIKKYFVFGTFYCLIRGVRQIYSTKEITQTSYWFNTFSVYFIFLVSNS